MTPLPLDDDPAASASHAWQVADDEAGQRLDRFVAARLDRPRHPIQGWIRDGRVTVDGRSAKPGTALAAGARVECRPPEAPPSAELEPEDGPLEVLYADQHLLAVDKPAGLAVHPGAGRPTGTLAHRLLARYPEIDGVGGRGRPGIVHRLDLDTTGVMVVARTDRAYHALAAAFAERRVEKRYVAIAYGSPKADSGRIDLPIGRHAHERKRMTVRGDGRPAGTRYRVRGRHEGMLCLFDLAIETGRTHQVRVHLKAIGHPLVGDPIYGEARYNGLPRRVQPRLRAFPRPALHARQLRLDHPVTGEPLELEAPEPDDLRQLWTAFAREPWPAPIEV